MKKSSSILILMVALIAGIIVATQQTSKSNCLSGEEKPGNKVEIYPKVCKQGLHQGPSGKFNIFVFCDDAQGSTIGIINPAPGAQIASGVENAWSLEKRFWQEQEWARDVDSYTWLEGDKLEVKTNSTYGSGKKYQLDLINRKILSEDVTN
jgi:hypothetical protein